MNPNLTHPSPGQLGTSAALPGTPARPRQALLGSPSQGPHIVLFAGASHPVGHDPAATIRNRWVP
jgi:hypothetical protein